MPSYNTLIKKVKKVEQKAKEREGHASLRNSLEEFQDDPVEVKKAS